MLTPYYETELGKLYHGDCLDIMPALPPVDLVVTSPPYDELRKYNGYRFDAGATIGQLSRIVAPGGVCVWVVADATVDGSETCTSFRQAIAFRAAGWWLYDTMIWKKTCVAAPSPGRYYNAFEYMFVFSKGRPKTINLINDRINITGGSQRSPSKHFEKEGRQAGGKSYKVGRRGRRYNVWRIGPSNHVTGHPAVFPLRLPKDHIVSWSNSGDTVLDPMSGSGTTLLAAEQLGRQWIGVEVSEKYCEIAAKRIEAEARQLKLF